MNIEILKVGKLECNCYLLEINGDVLVIDPGDDSDKIISHIGNRCVVGIIITHYHFDHIGAIDDIVKKYNTLVYDYSNMKEGSNTIGNFKFEVIYTPGHKEDCITLYFNKDKCMFCGDFIFKDNIGRCDLPGGNINQMVYSIKKIKKFPCDVIVYSGHGDKTSLLDEFNNNMYFQYDDENLEK